jgi:hypothetical protein
VADQITVFEAIDSKSGEVESILEKKTCTATVLHNVFLGHHRLFPNFRVARNTVAVKVFSSKIPSTSPDLLSIASNTVI